MPHNQFQQKTTNLDLLKFKLDSFPREHDLKMSEGVANRDHSLEQLCSDLYNGGVVGVCSLIFLKFRQLTCFVAVSVCLCACAILVSAPRVYFVSTNSLIQWLRSSDIFDLRTLNLEVVIYQVSKLFNLIIIIFQSTFSAKLFSFRQCNYKLTFSNVFYRQVSLWGKLLYTLTMLSLPSHNSLNILLLQLM